MVPFRFVPSGGRELLSAWNGSNARHDYGLKFMRETGQRRCAYCDTDLTTTYRTWLTLVLDHVLPVTLCRSLNTQSKVSSSIIGFTCVELSGISAVAKRRR
jgi:hypothetical protein